MLNNNDRPNAEFFRELLAAHEAMIADLGEAGDHAKTSSERNCTKSVLRQLNSTRDVLRAAVIALDTIADGTSDEWKERREKYLKRHAKEAVEAKENMQRELLRRNDQADWFTAWRLGTDFDTRDAFIAWNLFMITHHEAKKRVRPSDQPHLREQFIDFMRTKPAFTEQQRNLASLVVNAIFEVEKVKREAQ